MKRRIYLDYNASTSIAPEAVEAMRPFLTQHYGNPSSLHWAGTPAKDAVERARAQVAALLDCDPTEVVFTSGGSESNNHALKGVFFAYRERGEHIITTAVEHPAILNPCRFLERLGAQVSVLPVDRYGQVDPDDVRRALTPRTILVTVMHANNEVGTLQPLAEGVKAFEGTGPVEVMGFVSCGGCPGKRAIGRAKVMVERGAKAIVFASCISRGNLIGMPCPHFAPMRESISKAIGDEIAIIDYTH